MNKLMRFVSKNNYELVVVFLTFVLSVSAGIFYFSNHLNLQYNDAISHLDISRRITHSLTPGLVQIGSNWLPLLHFLEIPFTLNKFLWRTGLAGAFVSMVSFLFSSIFIFKIVFLITRDKVSSLIGVLAFVTNANMLYMQTAAMFEPLLIVNYVISIYFLLTWYKKDKISDLILAAIFVFLSTLTRYDGWFLFLASTLFVFVVTLKKKNYHKAEGRTILFATIAGLGIVLWLIYNQLIFGSPTYFASSPFSSRTQQIYFEKIGLLPARHHLFNAAWTYSVAILYNSGIIGSVLGLIGLIFFLLKKWNVSRIFTLLLIVPWIFNVTSLWLGQSIIWEPGAPPFNNSFFNVRYGLLAVPCIAIFIAILSSFKKIKYIIIPLVLLQAIIFYVGPGYIFGVKNLTVLKDTAAGNNPNALIASKWMGSACKNTLTLISSASYESTLFHSGLDLDKFITEGTGKYWKTSLINPSTYAGCVVYGASDMDAVRVSMDNNKDFESNFSEVQSEASLRLFKKNSSF